MPRLKLGHVKGQQGAQGLQGVQGVQGIPGATGTRGSQWFTGTGIDGTSTEAEVYEQSGVAEANVNDFYLNIHNGNVYTCRTPGDPNTAEWGYICSIRGPQPLLENSLTSTSTIRALSAAMGKVLNDKIDRIGLYPYEVRPKTVLAAYTAQLTIENVSTVLTFTDEEENTATYSYEKTGEAATAIVNVTIGTNIGFASSGAVLVSIKSSEALIHSYSLYNNNSTVFYSDEPNLWVEVNNNDANIGVAGAITETHNGQTAGYRNGKISRVWDGVRNALFPVTHAKSTWFNKIANRTMYDAMTDTFGTSDVFDPERTYSTGDYVIYNSALYRFNTSHTGAWDSNDVTKKDLRTLDTETRNLEERYGKNKLMSQVDLKPYNSESNMYTIPQDGYVSCGSSGGTQNGIIIKGGANLNPVLAIKTSNTEVTSLFVKKGMKVYVPFTTLTSQGYAVYYPLT